jgi:two-component system sensor histidine kinase AlgZ
MPADPRPDAGSSVGGLLPDFCSGAVLANAAFLAQALALAAALIAPPITESALNDLFLISLFLHWIALASVAALCLARPRLNRLSRPRALAGAYLILLIVVLFVGELALWALAAFGKLSTAHPPWAVQFHVQNLSVGAIIGLLALRVLVARHELRRSTLAESQARAELLRNRIRPHFLFNSMNIIAGLVRLAPHQAERAIEDLSDLFRLMLDESKDLVPLPFEVEVARKYLQLERLRLEDRLTVEFRIGDLPRAARTPALLIQILAEQAVQRCIEPRAEGGTVHVGVHAEAGMLRLSVEAPAPAPGVRDDRDSGAAALESARLRLKDHYGSEAALRVEEAGGKLFFLVTHPIRTER